MLKPFTNGVGWNRRCPTLSTTKADTEKIKNEIFILNSDKEVYARKSIMNFDYFNLSFYLAIIGLYYRTCESGSFAKKLNIENEMEYRI